MMKKLKIFIELMRPHQWYKNSIVFIGIIFSGNLLNFNLWDEVVSVFILLCIYSGIMYAINDVIDVEKDRQHPEKRKRPLPSKRIKKNEVIIISILLFIVATYWLFNLDLKTVSVMLFFFVTGLCYNFYLKNIFLLDIIIIGILFVLRAAAGCFVINVVITYWLILCTFLLALLVALGKRKKELELLGKDAARHRKVLQYYNNELIIHLLTSSLTILFVSYCIYAVLTKSGKYTIITIPVVTYLLFRYSYFILSKSYIPANPEAIFKDKGMIYGMTVWIILVLANLYIL